MRLPGWWVLTDFLAWWAGELRASFTSLLESPRLRGSTRLVLRLEGGRLPAREPSSLAGAVLTVVLPAGDVLVKELVLPAAAESSLDRVLAIQATRVFPLATAQLCLDYRVAQRIRATKQIVVH